MHTSPTDLKPTLSDALLEDLFNPSISTLDLCQIHKLTLPELAAILESESYQLAVDCSRRINTARQSLIEPEAAALAMTRLHDMLKDRPQTPAHAETLRKTACKVIPMEPRPIEPATDSAPATATKKAASSQTRLENKQTTDSDLRPLALHQVHDQRDQEQKNEQEEQDLGDLRRIARDATEAEDGRDDRDDKENDSPSKHDVLLSHDPNNLGCAQHNTNETRSEPKNATPLRRATGVWTRKREHLPTVPVTRRKGVATETVLCDPSSGIQWGVKPGYHFALGFESVSPAKPSPGTQAGMVCSIVVHMLARADMILALLMAHGIPRTGARRRGRCQTPADHHRAGAGEQQGHDDSQTSRVTHEVRSGSGFLAHDWDSVLSRRGAHLR